MTRLTLVFALSFFLMPSLPEAGAAPHGGFGRGGGFAGGGRAYGGYRGVGGGYRGGFGGYNGVNRGHYGNGYRGYYGGYRGYRGWGYGYGYGYPLGFGFGWPWYSSGWDYPNDSGISTYPAIYSQPAPTPVYYAQPPEANPNPNPAAPVVVNQYYSQAPVRERQDPPPARDSSERLFAKQPNMVLIAFPNGSVVIAIAYWLDGNTLHYVTREKAVKTFALASIDRVVTEQLNRERGLEFTLQ